MSDEDVDLGRGRTKFQNERGGGGGGPSLTPMESIRGSGVMMVTMDLLHQGGTISGTEVSMNHQGKGQGIGTTMIGLELGEVVKGAGWRLLMSPGFSQL